MAFSTFLPGLSFKVTSPHRVKVRGRLDDQSKRCGLRLCRRQYGGKKTFLVCQ